MALIGSTIDPSLFVNDYSGFANAGGIQGQATAQIGKDIGDSVTMFKEMKAQEGQTNAFGKSMDAMAQAFPDQAEMFNGLKMDVLDPNASLIERVSRMNQTRETLNMINQQRTMNMNQELKNYQMSGAGAAGGAGGATGGDDWTKDGGLP